jgi:hypothetical protein
MASKLGPNKPIEDEDVFDDINPVNTSQFDFPVDSTTYRDPISYTKAAVDNLAKMVVDGRSHGNKLYGRVYRVEAPITSLDNKAIAPSGLGQFLGDDKQKIIKERQVFKIWVPGYSHPCLKPDSPRKMPTGKKKLTAYEQKQHYRISQLDTFIADYDTNRIVEGQWVEVTYKKTDHSDAGGICIKAISDYQDSDESSDTSAQQAMKAPCDPAAPPTGIPLDKNPKRNTAKNKSPEQLVKDIQEYKKKFGVGDEVKEIGEYYHIREWLGEGTNDNDIEPYGASDGHSKNSAHYSSPSEALDIPVPDGAPIGDAIAKFWEDKGYAVIWRAKGHYNHVHVSWRDNDRGMGQRAKEVPEVAAGQIPEGASKSVC